MSEPAPNPEALGALERLYAKQVISQEEGQAAARMIARDEAYVFPQPPRPKPEPAPSAAPETPAAPEAPAPAAPADAPASPEAPAEATAPPPQEGDGSSPG